MGFKRQVKVKKMTASLQRLRKRVLFVPRFYESFIYLMKLPNVVVEGEVATLAGNPRHVGNKENPFSVMRHLWFLSHFEQIYVALK